MARGAYCCAYPPSTGDTNCCALYGWACDAKARSFFNASSIAGELLRPHATLKTTAGATNIQVSFRIAISEEVISNSRTGTWHAPFRALTDLNAC